MPIHDFDISVPCQKTTKPVVSWGKESPRKDHETTGIWRDSLLRNLLIFSAFYSIYSIYDVFSYNDAGVLNTEMILQLIKVKVAIEVQFFFQNDIFNGRLYKLSNKNCFVFIKTHTLTAVVWKKDVWIVSIRDFRTMESSVNLLHFICVGVWVCACMPELKEWATNCSSVYQHVTM